MPHGWSYHNMSLRLAEGVDGSFYSFLIAYSVARWTDEHQSVGFV